MAKAIAVARADIKNRRQMTDDRGLPAGGGTEASKILVRRGEDAIQRVLQVSRILYKTAYYFAKQSQLSKKSNGYKLKYNKGL